MLCCPVFYLTIAVFFHRLPAPLSYLDLYCLYVTVTKSSSLGHVPRKPLLKESIQSPTPLQAVQSVITLLLYKTDFFFPLTFGKCYAEQGKCSMHPPLDQRSTGITWYANLLSVQAAVLPCMHTEKSFMCHTSSTFPATHTIPSAMNFTSNATTGKSKQNSSLCFRQ